MVANVVFERQPVERRHQSSVNVALLFGGRQRRALVRRTRFFRRLRHQLRSHRAFRFRAFLAFRFAHPIRTRHVYQITRLRFLLFTVIHLRRRRFLLLRYFHGRRRDRHFRAGRRILDVFRHTHRLVERQRFYRIFAFCQSLHHGFVRLGRRLYRRLVSLRARRLGTNNCNTA